MNKLKNQPRTMELTFINCLPIELLTEILIKTDGKTVGKCRRVCKKWKSIIDDADLLWKKICFIEFRHSSRIAKEKRHSECQWYNIYRNLIVWNNVTNYEVHLREFLEFPLDEFERNLNYVTLNDNVRTEDTIYFSLERNYPKIANNYYALVVFFKLSLVVVRPVKNTEYLSERFYQADGYSLSGNKLYFYRNKEVFICDLLSKDLESKLFYNSDFKIKEIQHFNGQTFLFTHCGKIVTISMNNVNNVRVQPLNCPQELFKKIKYICAINDKNYICYSSSLFKIETEKYKHLYFVGIPPITALFFYGDFALIGTKSGEILLYRQSIKKSKPLISPPKFEVIAQLPDDDYAVELDVSERRSGPVIIVTISSYYCHRTPMLKIMFLEIDFFAGDKDNEIPLSIERVGMYKKLLKIRDALNSEVSAL